jgi:hypothetical protein
MLAQQNIEILKEAAPRTIVASCPHYSNTIATSPKCWLGRLRSAGAPDAGAAPIGDPAVGAVTAGNAEPKSAVVTPELMGQDPAADRTDAARRALTCALVIFGAPGDLTERKLLPAIRLRGAKTVSCAL